jgi:hypothetical protein
MLECRRRRSSRENISETDRSGACGGQLKAEAMTPLRLLVLVVDSRCLLECTHVGSARRFLSLAGQQNVETPICNQMNQCLSMTQLDLLQYGPENLLDTGDILIGEGEEHLETRARPNSKRSSSLSKPITLDVSNGLN